MVLTEFGLAIIEPGDDFVACADALAPTYPHEFAVYPSIDPGAIEAAALAGFMPMAVSGLPFGAPALLPKLHLERCVAIPGELRASRTARRESSRYALSVNRAFGEVLRGCVATHGDDWLVPELAACFEALHAQRSSRRAAFISFELWRKVGVGEAAGADADGLAAGEFGYLIGSAYASLSGFYSVPGAGTVQLSATAAALATAGVEVWDLGMVMDYKLRLGGRSMPRLDFLATLREAYSCGGRGSAASGPKDKLRGLVGGWGKVGARELIDGGAGLESGR